MSEEIERELEMTPRDTRIDRALNELVHELHEATDRHPEFNSAHEGWAVIHEELDELWEHVRANSARTDDARHEAIQIAAMAIRFAAEITDE